MTGVHALFRYENVVERGRRARPVRYPLPPDPNKQDTNIK